MPPETPPTRNAQMRELIGLALLFIGAVVVHTAAFLFDARLGLAVLGVMALAGGIALTFGEE